MRILSRLPGLHILDVDIYALDGLDFDFELAGRGRPARPAAHTFFPFFALITLVNLKVIFHQFPAQLSVNQYKFEV